MDVANVVTNMKFYCHFCLKWSKRAFFSFHPAISILREKNPLKISGDAIGDCLTDTFTINAPGNIGSPVICGTNSGYHSMILLNQIDTKSTVMYHLQ